MSKRLVLFIMLLVLVMPGCAVNVPKDALRLSPESLADRQIQTRRFETANNETMLSAAAAVFQDLGFTMEESEYTLGVLVGSKQRDATSAGQIAGAVLLAALTGAVMHVDSNQVIRASMVMREIQAPEAREAAQSKITPQTLRRIQTDVNTAVANGLLTHFPQEISRGIAEKIANDTAKTLTDDLSKLMRNHDNGQCTVRVTFQRVVYNTAGQITLNEQLNEPELYQQFFDKLSQSVFLEAHEL